MKTSVSDYLFSPLAWIQIVVLFLLLTLLALILTPLGPLLGAWAGNTFVKPLTIEGVSGSLLSDIKVKKIEWRDGDVTTLNDINLRVGRPDFGANLLPIEQLSIQSLAVDLLPTATPRKRGELVDIGDFGTAPVNLLIHSGKLSEFRVVEAGENLFQMDEVLLGGTEVKDNQLYLKNATANMVIASERIALIIPRASMNMMVPHEINLDGTLSWEHTDVGRVTADLQGEGLLQSYQLTADGKIVHPELGTQTFAVKGKGDFDFLDIRQVTLSGDSGSLLAEGEVAWVPDLSVDLDVAANALNTAQFTPEWPADLTGKLALKITQEAGKLRGGLDIKTLNGTLRGYPLKGSGRVSMLNNELLFDKLELKSASNTLKVNGRGSEPFDLSWDIHGRDLSALMLGVAGRVSAKGQLTGSMDKPEINGQLNATRLSFQGHKLDSGDLSIKTVEGQFQLDGRFTGLLVNGERILNATVSGRGDVDQHSISLTANHTQATVNASVDGKWDGQHWQGVLKTVDIKDRTFGRWHLQKPANVTVSAQGLVADELCVAGDDGSACTNVKYTQQDGFRTAGKLTSAPLEMLNPLIPQGFRIQGRVNGDYSIAVNEVLTGKADLTFAPGQLIIDQEGSRQRIAYRTGRLATEINGNNIKANTRFSLLNDGVLDAAADIQLSPNDGQHQIRAAGELKSIPLALGQAFLPEDMSVSGLVSGSFNVRQEGDQRNGKLQLGSQDVQFIYADKAAGRQRYSFNQVRLNATLVGEQLDADTQLNLVTGGHLDARVDLSADDLSKAIIAEGQVKDMPLALARPYLPKAFDADGLVGGSFNIRQEGGQPVGQVDLLASNGVFAYQPAGEQAQEYLYNTAKVQASIRGEKVDGNVDFDLKNGGKFSGRAAVDLGNPDFVKAVNAEGKIDAMPLAMLRPYLPKTLDVDGLVSGEYNVNQQSGEPVGRFNLLSNGGSVVYQAEGSVSQRYDYHAARLEGQLQGDKLQANVALELKDGGVLRSNVSADISSLERDPVFTAEGTIQEMPMALAQAYLPEGLVVNGRINAEYQIQQQGKLMGKVRLNLPASSFSYSDGSITPQTYRYRSAELTADIDGNKVVTDVAFTLQDGGSFTTQGRLDISQPHNLFAFEGSGNLDAFPLALLQPYLPLPVTFEGVAKGHYQLSQTGGQKGSVQLTLPASRFSVTDAQGKQQTFAYEEGLLNATINGKSIIADAKISLEKGGVIDSQANILLGGNATSHRITVEGNLASVPLALIEPYLSEDVSFPGKVNGRYSLRQQRAKLSGKVNLSLPNSYFVVKTASGDERSFAYQQGVLNATINDNRINVNSTLVFKAKGDLQARVQIVLRDKGDPSINGVAEVNIPNIHWAQPYVPNSRGLRGKVVGKVNVSGLVSRPRVTGQLAMSEGYLRLPQVGTELTDINIRVQADRANQAVIVGSMKSGDGVISANGYLSLADVKNWTAKMSLSGQNIQFVDTYEAKAYMTPNLQIEANPKAVVIRGTVDIPKADINLKDVPEFSIDESEDVIVIGEKRPSSTINVVRLRPNILVRLGRDVRFKGFGFSTRLAGGLRITNNRNTIVTNGSLSILEGRYEAYGQNLKIDDGRLVFNGPPKNVGVDVRAIRKLTDGEVGIHLTGTIQKLKSTIFSDPVMQETDALSYLVTGHSLASSTGRETALLMQAVRGLGIDGSDGLIQRIGKSLGLDDLSIVTRDDFRESELQLGKKLGSKLYVRYLVGIFDKAHRLAIDYKINKYLNLEVQAGGEQSVDLIYEYEKE
ncbi:MAG: hypothetical protein CSB47_07750 [Proteobacteria bacterium]|nr:MAG: hypothetical protein CSB47_07750 [Pseudomonadota bacterium]